MKLYNFIFDVFFQNRMSVYIGRMDLTTSTMIQKYLQHLIGYE